ncbi:MAG TPA: DUF2490 domain-containing protein [Gemmatimonadaceae bacterium]|nr:DUF2490 domain-containing protein [Gemmatimonadaceae bacterium]
MRRRLGSAVRTVVVGIAAPWLPASVALAQTTVNESWAELDVYYSLPSTDFRLFGMSQVARGLETDSRQLTLGIHVDYLPHSWIVWRVGYRWLRSISEPFSPPEERALGEVAVRRRVQKFAIRNRTRLELRWIAGEPSQRWRDQIRVDREVALSESRRLYPYATFELYWDSRYHALSRSAYRVGADLVMNRTLTFDLSYARQDNRFGSPRHVNAIWPRVELRYW